MNRTTIARRIAAGAAAGALALGVFACAGCAGNTVLHPGAHAYHETDTDWDLAYGWYEAGIPDGFIANDLGTVFATTADRLYTFDNSGTPNTSDYQSIQVRLERGYIDDTEVKTTASDTAWSNDPDYDNAIPFIELKTTYEGASMKLNKLSKIVPVVVFVVLAVGLIAGISFGTISAFGWDTISALCPLGAITTMVAIKTLLPRAIAMPIIASKKGPAGVETVEIDDAARVEALETGSGA